MFNSVYKRCNSNDTDAWCDTVSGELHATFFDSPSNGSHALPPTAQSVAPPMEQSVAYRRHGMAGAVGAGELPLNPSVHTRPLVRPHIRYVGAFTPHDETIPVNVGCPVPASTLRPETPTQRPPWRARATGRVPQEWCELLKVRRAAGGCRAPSIGARGEKPARRRAVHRRPTARRQRALARRPRRCPARPPGRPTCR